MSAPFEISVSLDARGRIVDYAPAQDPENKIEPGVIGSWFDGDEPVFVSVSGIEYSLTSRGSLIHPEVEVPDNVTLEPGVRLDEGTTFHDDDVIHIQRGTRIEGTEVYGGVALDNHSVVRAQFIGSKSVVGAYVRIGHETGVGSGVHIGDTTKIDDQVQIASGVRIGENARLGFNTRIGRDAVIGDRARIGAFGGEGGRGVNQDGPLILPGKVIPPGMHIHD